jgi:bleomycin hydrolase
MKKYFIFIFLFYFCLYGQDATNKSNIIKKEMQQPNSVEGFNAVFHFPPVNQDTTYVCWSFSTLSFIESEMKKLGRQTVKLSVIYPVYFGFIEKAKYYIQTKGKSRFYAGDLFGTVINVIKKYGIVPEKNYTGKLTKKKTYNHNMLYNELYAYMDNVKKDSLWNEKIVIPKLIEILDKHIGSPPKEFVFNNKNYTPVEFANEVVNLQWNDYIKITSFKNTIFSVHKSEGT